MMITKLLSKKLWMQSYFKISHRIDYLKDFESETISMKNENELNQQTKHLWTKQSNKVKRTLLKNEYFSEIDRRLLWSIAHFKIYEHLLLTKMDMSLLIQRQYHLKINDSVQTMQLINEKN